MSFSHFGLVRELETAFASLGYIKPFPVQEQTIPAVLDGKDCVIQAQTGSGKTIAFLAPIIHRLTKPGSRKILRTSTRALIIVPTRELAMQVSARAIELVKHLSITVRIRIAFGGVSINPQMISLKGGMDILIATPGRLLDLVRCNAVSLGDIDFLVIDEADKLLDSGFTDEMSEIKNLLPAARQTILLSATMNTAVDEVVRTFLNDPVTIHIEPATEFTASIVEKAYLLPQEHKGPFLRELLTFNDWNQILIFVNSGRRADNVTHKLNTNGIHALALHGDKSQGARTDALKKFRSGALRVLVATDLLSRGIDIIDLPCVINYELPRSARDYVHRIGRTGRAGAEGISISLVSPDEENHLRLIEKTINRRIVSEDI
jgi:ATP-dependent RNA helicase RhlE